MPYHSSPKDKSSLLLSNNTEMNEPTILQTVQNQTVEIPQADDHGHGNFINANITFPWKLHLMLEAAERKEPTFSDIVSWLPNNRGFRVHRISIFVNDIMPQYFRQTKYKSFQRQLNMWGFERILTGKYRGGYTHTHFVRGSPSLCRFMKRLKIKGESGSAVARKNDHTSEPECAFNPKSMGEREKSTTAAHPSKCPVAIPALGASTNNSLGHPDKFNGSISYDLSLSTPALHRGAADSIPLSAQQNDGQHSDIFKDEALSAALKDVVERQEKIEGTTPSDGDAILFEGMQFYFVSEDDPTSKQSRRLSIQFGLRPGGTRRYSLTGGFDMDSQAVVEVCDLLPQTPTITPGSSRQCQGGHSPGTYHTKRPIVRRFSLERNADSNDFFLKQIFGF